MSFVPNPNDPRYQQSGQPSPISQGYGQYGQQYPGYPHQAQGGYAQYPPQYGQNYNSPPPQQPAFSAALTGPTQAGQEVQWIPPTNDIEFVDRWFKELDKEGRGIVGGLDIAMFLKRSNLPKESLRTIWSLVDNRNLGYVNKSQFNNIIRLVSISCSPIYMGSPPSLERLQKTLYDKIALPAALLEEPESTASVTLPPSVIPLAGAQSVGGLHSPSTSYVPHTAGVYPVSAPIAVGYPAGPPPPQVQQAPAAAHDDDDTEFSDFSSATHAPVTSLGVASSGSVGMLPPRAAVSQLGAVLDEFGPLSTGASPDTPVPAGPQWVPPPADQELIDKWFAELDTEMKGTVGGLAIATFLKKSNLPKETLRTIWSLVDNKNAGSVNKEQFTNIIRLVSISCSPIYMGAPPSMDRFLKTLGDNIRLPFALTEETATAGSNVDNSIKSSASVEGSAVYASVPMQRTPSGASAPPVPAASVPPPVREINWVPPPIDVPYLDKWFAELDKDNKGTLGGLAVAMFLKRTNLPTEALRAIWAIIDSAQLGFVNKVQFTNMMRLAAIQCHPAYSAYPPSLERLQQTLGEFIPLPLALVHEQSLPPVDIAPGQTPSVAPNQPVPTDSSAIPSVVTFPSPMNRSASAASLDDISDLGSISTAPDVLPVPAPVQAPVAHTSAAQWVPPPSDATSIDLWFAELDREGKGTIGGLACAMFLKRSNLPKETLRTIWSLVDSANVGHVNKAQFTNMVRMVSIQCSPVHTGVPPTLEQLQSTLQEFIPLPASLFASPDGVSENTATSVPLVAPVTLTGPELQVDTVQLPPLEPVPTGPQWVPPPADQELIDKWFAELDTEMKGTVGGLAIATFLKKSNLPKETLRTIWSLVDNKNAGSVNKEQFTNIIRLVSISCSPIYMGAPPSMDRFLKTLQDEISLPYALTDPSLSTAITAAPAVVPIAPPANSVSFDQGDDDDGMSDFSPPVLPNGAASGDSNKLADFEIRGSLALGKVGASVPAPASAPAAHRLSVFDDLVENDLKAMDDDWDEFTGGTDVPGTAEATSAVVEAALPATSADSESSSAEGSTSAPEVPAITSSAIDVMDLLSDDFSPAPPAGEFHADQEAPLTGIPAAKSIDFFDFDTPAANAPLPGPGAADLEDEDEDFGDFDAAPSAAAASIDTSVLNTEQSDKSQQAVASSNISANQGMDDLEETESAENDDFGDFETHSPMPSMTQLESKASLFDMDASTGTGGGGGGSNFGTINHSISELSLFDAPGDQSDDFMQDAFAVGLSGSGKPATQEVDLLDFLSEPSPTASAAPVFPISHPPVHSYQQQQPAATFAAFEDPFGAHASQNSLAPVNASFEADFGTATSSSLLDDDLFCDPVAAPSVVTPAATSAPPQRPPQTASRDTASLLTRKHLKSKALDALTASLMQKCLYEHAYNCNEQAKLARSIEDLTVQKARAVEDDDLETAMILKKDISLLQLKVNGVDQEVMWEEEAQSGRSGESIQETADLLCAVDDVMGAKFKRCFLTALPPASAALDVQLKFYVTAKRYARMVLAICSTHNMYPKQWLQVLQVAVAKVKEGNEIVARFKQLSAPDRNALISHLKMSEYALGLVAMSEIGMWVSASCTEAMVHEKIAGEVYAVCQDLLTEVDQLWGMGSRFKAMDMDTLTLEAAKLAENKNVQYCNFTLRPLSYEICKRDGDKMKVDTMKLYDTPVLIENSHFMEPVIKLWLHDVAKEMPQCAAAVF